MNHDHLNLLLSGSNTALLVWITFVDLRQLREDFIKHLANHATSRKEVVAHG